MSLFEEESRYLARGTENPLITEGKAFVLDGEI